MRSVSHSLFTRNLFLFSALLLCLLYACKSTEPVTGPDPDPVETPDPGEALAETPSDTGTPADTLAGTLTATGIPADTLAGTPTATGTPADTTKPVDADSLIATMSLREKIGQLFTIPVYGTFRNERDPQLMEWKHLVEEYHIGGLIFMNGDVYGQAMVTNTLQSVSNIPLWISQDMEYGAAMRVSGTTRFTPAMGVAATGNPENAFITGRITAREARALGVNQIYAPVLDVNNNPDNPVINVRSFSEDPETVARFGEAFIRGVESEGLVATAKHFPGHGDTDIDSHLALPVIDHTYSRLDSVELYPFRSAIHSGLSSIMSAHIAFPLISSSPELPGTLDKEVLNHILVDSLGFTGLVVTDGLEMSGITNRFSPGETVVRALQAGADVMLISPDAKTAIHEVEQAVHDGELTEERIEVSLKKILDLKNSHHLFESDRVFTEALSSLVNTPEYEAESGRIARESITLLKNEGSILPIREIDRPRILFVAVADDASGTTGSVFASEMRKYHSNVIYRVLDQRTSVEEKTEILEQARRADLIIIGSFIYVRSHQPIQLTTDQVTFLQLLTAEDVPSALIAFGNPYVLRDLPDTDVHLLAWASNSVQAKNTVPALFSGATVEGRLPITIPGLHDIGDGISLTHTGLRFDTPESAGMRTDSLMKIDEIMQDAIENATFPGGVVTVVRDGAVVWNRGYGYYDYNRLRRVSASSVYDLASVTKTMATTTAIMKLVDDGLIDIQDPVSMYIDEFSNGEKQQVTIEQLLLHTSGLPAFRVYVDLLKTREEILDAIKREPLDNIPGETYVYSDLGFILLAEIVEAVSGEPIDRYTRRNFYIPMGMSSTHFNPYRVGSWLLNQIPPTEVDEIYDRGVVRGRVHDERAWFMDGVAGHAGLFSSAGDLAGWAQMLLNKGVYMGRRYISSETVDLFTGRRSSINQRGYGFDRKSEEFSSAGELTSSRTFGHLGFTGTSVWIDPENKVTIILLTNRTYPSREDGEGIRQVRPAVADAVMRSIIE